MYNIGMKKAVFLDRDGIINELIFFPEAGIVDTPLTAKQVKLVFGIEQLITESERLGFLIVVISNQPAVGLKKLSKKDFESINNKINELLLKKGVGLTDTFYCLHHPFAKLLKYKKKCNCRKPKIGLFNKAYKKYAIDLSRSWMIGDGVDDIKAGKKAGCKTILLANINATENLRILEEQLKTIKPDFTVKNLLQALKIIRDLK